MKIEVGKEYKVLLSKLGFKKGDIIGVVDEDVEDESRYCVVINRFENRRVSKFGLESMMLERYGDAFTDPPEYPEGTKLTENGLYTITEPSKPAHYDTAIDTLAFAKANFSREQVEGFMRINAIKYLQRNKGEKLSDLRKAAHYISMLIEMEEEK